MGIGQDPEPQLKGGRMLIVSPFVSEGGLRTLDTHRQRVDLVSRAESLDQLPATSLGPRLRLSTFDVASDPAAPESDPAPVGIVDTQLSGLHAKLTVSEYRRSAYARIGSQNATEAAFTRNVEAMVMLHGRIDVLGIDKTLSGLGDLLVDHEPQPPAEADPDLALDRMLTGLLTRTAATPVRIRVQPAGDHFRLCVSVDSREVEPLPTGVSIEWAPATSPGILSAWPPGPPASPTVLEGSTWPT
ncbi:hypothetical protein G7085_05625 [Tessaracoccus sp. HDW20]|uniref:phospholipase D family protein n=1 Tax=Tessaracoccus coleopterorum TaxID=2714950 RepID=UPI0018D40255|nr:phospholipase D family protein [Tessaracoccus coleopterorum]NHB84272.1 hypothetical protein [Tessaracoccus coleopterorum]